MEVAEFKWRAEHGARQMSWSTMLGLLLLAAATLFLVSDGYPEFLKIRRLEAANAVLVRNQSVQQVQKTPQSAALELQRFYGLLPSVDDIPSVLASITRDAAAQSVILSEGQFKLTFDPDSSVGRYQMVLPVKAGYAATRQFVRAALKDTPALSLQELSFERADPTSTLANARIQFVLYVLPSGLVKK